MPRSLAPLVFLIPAACAPAPPVRDDAIPLRTSDSLAQENPAPRRILTLKDVGDVSDLAWLEEGGRRVLLVAGTCGIVKIDVDREQVVASRRFELECPPLLSSRIVDLDLDGDVELARFDPGWVGPTAVLDLEGRVLWQHPSPGGYQDVVDLDGDGRGEILTREPNDETLVLRDHAGAVRWRRPVPEFALAVLDLEGDGRREILASGGEAVHVFDADGAPIRALAVPGGGFVNLIRVVPGADGAGPELCVGAYVQRRGEKGQWFHRFTADARTHLGRTRDEPAGAPDLETTGRDGALLALSLEHALEQAFPAGFSGSELRLSIRDASGTTLARHHFERADGEASTTGGRMIRLPGDPPRVWLGYGDAIFEVALP